MFKLVLNVPRYENWTVIPSGHQALAKYVFALWSIGLPGFRLGTWGVSWKIHWNAAAAGNTGATAAGRRLFAGRTGAAGTGNAGVVVAGSSCRPRTQPAFVLAPD